MKIYQEIFQILEFDSFVFETSDDISPNGVVWEGMKDEHMQENIDDEYSSKSMVDHTMQYLSM